MRKTIALDFDGVIHTYWHGWHDGSIYDEPVPGALEALKYLLARYYVFIFTAREVSQVASWLRAHGFQVDDHDNGSPTWEVPDVLLVTNRKLAASIYVDDRGLRFWSWQKAIPEIDFLVAETGSQA